MIWTGVLRSKRRTTKAVQADAVDENGRGQGCARETAKAHSREESSTETDMTQDGESGARASRYGHECASKIAATIGAKKLSNKSNDCLLDGEQITIKSAKKDTNRIGVYLVVLERVVGVFGAFQEESGLYRVIRLTKAQFSEHMDERDYGKGKMGQVTRSVFERYGSLIAEQINID